MIFECSRGHRSLFPHIPKKKEPLFPHVPKKRKQLLSATERGELLVRYTGGPQRFAFPVGLEGEIRNFASHDWVILDTLRNRQIIRQSKRWTIARHQPPHLKGWRSPGLLPSTTYTADQIFTRAKEYFGTTTNPDKAGYILPDGIMLDFSGDKYAPPRTRRVAPILGAPGIRELDHREITFAWPEDDAPGGLEGMKRVMNWGAIRFSTFADTVVVNLIHYPTDAQTRAVREALNRHPDAVLVVEVDKPDLDQIDFADFLYPFTNWRAFIERTLTLDNSPVTVSEY